ncbi:MAG: hypothetical protein ACK5NN_16045 [Sphingomonadaceae bacterium]
MNFWTAAVIIVAIWGVVQMYRARHGILSDEDGNQFASPPSTESEAQRQELEELRERVKVLERIATDANTLQARETQKISSEIEKLRD